MWRVKEHSTKTEIVIYRTLLVIAAAVLLILIAGTIYGLIRQDNVPEAPEFTHAGGGEDIFSGLGTLRIPTADHEPETLIISIAFPYNRYDRPFSEELASRLSWFKTATTQYLGAFTAEDLAALDIETINNELLSLYNAALRLGQIRELYILEFIQL